MSYSDLKYINAEGGIQCLRDDGVYDYFEPGTTSHTLAVNEEWGPVAAFEEPTAIISADQVKEEASRRITESVPEWRQRNLLAQAAILSEKTRAAWTSDEVAAWEHGISVWQGIELVRAASNAIEGMDPIPADYTDDKYWP